MNEVKELKELLEAKVKADFLVDVLLGALTKYSDPSKDIYIMGDDNIISALRVAYPEKLEKRLKELGAKEDKEDKEV